MVLASSTVPTPSADDPSERTTTPITRTASPGRTANTGSAATTGRTASIDLRAGLPTGDSKRQAVQSMFDAISGRYDLVNRVMTFGLDTSWRKRTVRALGLEPNATVLDLAAGTGDLCRDLQRSGYQPIGLDLSMGMLRHAKTTAQLGQADVLALPIRTGSVDGVTCGFALRNFVDLAAFFTELARVVRPGGRIALLDASAPEQPLLRFGHRIYFGSVVPKIGGLLSDRDAYRYLPKSLGYMPEPEELHRLIRSAGFSGVQRQTFLAGSAYLVVGTRIGIPTSKSETSVP